MTSPLPILPAFHRMTAAELGAMTERINELSSGIPGAKSVDESRASTTTLAGDAELFVTVEGSASYLFEWEHVWLSPAAAGFKTQFVVPSGCTSVVGGRGTGSFSGVSLTAPLNWGGTGADQHGRLFGYVATSSPGVIQLTWAQFTSNASPTILRAGSFLRLTRIS